MEIRLVAAASPSVESSQCLTDVLSVLMRGGTEVGQPRADSVSTHRGPSAEFQDQEIQTRRVPPKCPVGTYLLDGAFCRLAG